MMKKVLYLLIILVVAWAFIFMGDDTKDNNSKKEATYALTPAIIDTPAVTTWKKGLWNTDFVTFDIKSFTTGREAVEALTSKQVDFASMASLPFLLASRNNPDLRVIAIISTANSISIVGNKEKGIETTEDLEGKKIAMTAGTTGQFYLDTFMAENNFVEGSFDVVNLSPPAMLAALERGDIDAICTWDPHIQTAINLLGENAVEIESARQHRPVKFLVATRVDVIEEKPEVIEALMRGLLKAEAVILSEEDQIKEMVSNNSNISLSDLNNIWQNFDFSLKLDSQLIDLWQEEQNWGTNSGLMSPDLRSRDELKGMIESSFLADIDSSRMTY